MVGVQYEHLHSLLRHEQLAPQSAARSSRLPTALFSGTGTAMAETRKRAMANTADFIAAGFGMLSGDGGALAFLYFVGGLKDWLFGPL